MVIFYEKVHYLAIVNISAPDVKSLKEMGRGFFAGYILQAQVL
jgi:hypothetical protein